MAKFAELVSALTIKGTKSYKSSVGKRLTSEVAFANREVQGTQLSKAEKKAIVAGFDSLNKASRERDLAYENKRKEERKKKGTAD